MSDFHTHLITNNALLSFGSTDAAHVERAVNWTLRNPDLGADDPNYNRVIENRPDNYVPLFAALKAGWQLINDTESLAGLDTEPRLSGARFSDEQESE